MNKAPATSRTTSKNGCRRQRNMPGPRLGLPKKFHREQPRQVEARCFPTRSDTGGTPGPRLGLPKKLQREQTRQVEARRFPTRFGSSGTLAGEADSGPPAQPGADRRGVRQARTGGVVETTPRLERRWQRSISGPRLGLPKKVHREQPRQVEARCFSIRSDTGGTPGPRLGLPNSNHFGFSSTLAGAGERKFEPSSCLPAQPAAGRQGVRRARDAGVAEATSRTERRRQRSIPVAGAAA